MSIRATMAVLGSATVLAAALVACSSSSKGNGSTGTPDSGQVTNKGDSGSTAPPGDGGTTTDTGSSTPPSDGGSSADCETPPKVYSESTPGVYCPYSGVDGGKAQTCAAGEHCCETPYSANTPSTCQPAATTCPVAMSTDWQCLGAIDCAARDAGTPVCCGNGTMMTVTSCGNSWSEPSGFTGSTCATSCASSYTICYSAADCTAVDAGTTCTASKAEGNDFGYCTP